MIHRMAEECYNYLVAGWMPLNAISRAKRIDVLAQI